MTNQLFDEQITNNKQAYMVFLLRDRFTTNSINKDNNEVIYKLLLNSESIGVRVGWVDVYDEGELIKETFDIETFPTAVYIYQGMFYLMPSPETNPWTPSDFTRYLS